jgi:alkaline phosphatase isozyme conversion protein
MGYTVEIYSFDTDYGFTHGDGFKSKRPVKSYNVVATKKGASDKVVVVGSHVDSRLPRHEKDFAKRLGGKDLEGIDDNASGIGMLLELANQIKDTPTENTVKFVAFGAEEIGLKGSHEYIKRLSAAEKQNTSMPVKKLLQKMLLRLNTAIWL